jgi:hypothetical protein
MRYDESSLPERRLMQSVIITAISDARGDTRDRRPERVEADKRAAISWITEAGADFREVCDLAGLDADCVRTYALAFIASGDKFPRAQKHPPTRTRNPLAPHAIAVRAGVSPSAVYAVLNQGIGSQAMQRRVRATMQEIASELAQAA